MVIQNKNSINVFYFIAAYSEISRIASNIENSITGAEVQKVLVIVSRHVIQKWVLRCD